MIKVNIKLKNLFVEHIEKETENIYSIAGIDPEYEKSVIDEIVSCMEEEHYFVYQKGSTKYNDKLIISSKEEINDFLKNGYVIYEPLSLSSISMGLYDIYTDTGVQDNKIEIEVNGKYEKILHQIALKFDFEKTASRLPEQKQ